MATELKIAIENLYNAFSGYPFKSTMEGCPCCISGSDIEKIHTKQLRDLSGDDLSRYAFKAMTTWGDIGDFKHYLPRIFELLATTDLGVDTFVVLGKLEFGNWKEWSETEKNAVVQFLWACWSDTIRHKSSFDKDLFTQIYYLTGDIDQLLDRWSVDMKDNSFSNLVDFVYNYYNDLLGKRAEFREIDNASIEKLIKWTKGNSKYFERGFFHFADKNSDFAGKISAAQFIYEHT